MSRYHREHPDIKPDAATERLYEMMDRLRAASSRIHRLPHHHMKTPPETNYETQLDGDVWVRHNRILKILPAGLAADAFLASVDKRTPGEVNAIIRKLFKGTVAI